jgi:hypothetical protein
MKIVERLIGDWLIFWCLTPLSATSFSGGRSQNTWREPPTMSKQLVNFITCDCESSAPFFVIYKVQKIGRLPRVLEMFWQKCVVS